MENKKAVYENLINCSPLFELDREKESVAYKREVLKMVEYLYLYLAETGSAEKKEFAKNHAVEITETAQACIRNYTGEVEFLFYFLSTWKENAGHALGKELFEDEFGGMRFTDAQFRAYRNYVRLARSKGIDCDTQDFVQAVMEVMGITEAEARELHRMVLSRTVSIEGMAGDEEEFSLLDTLDSGERVDSASLQRVSVLRILDIAEETFEGLQERQKPMVAVLLTNSIALMTLVNDDVAEAIKSKRFFEKETFEKVMSHRKPLMAKDIADRFGAEESAVSRKWKGFKEKLQAALREKD